MVSLTLSLDSRVPLAVLTASSTSASICVHPDSLSVKFNLSSASLSDLSVNGTLFPQLIQDAAPLYAPTAAAASIASLPLISVEFTKNPMDNKDLAGRLLVTLQQRQIVLHVPFFKNIIDFFQTPPDLDLRGT